MRYIYYSDMDKRIKIRNRNYLDRLLEVIIFWKDVAASPKQGELRE